MEEAFTEIGKASHSRESTEIYFPTNKVPVKIKNRDGHSKKGGNGKCCWFHVRKLIN